MKNDLNLHSKELELYHQTGFLIQRHFLDAEATALLQQISKSDPDLIAQAQIRKDRKGSLARLSVRNALNNDIYSAIVRSRSMVDTMEMLLGGEVYHYHHKMIIKQPGDGGAWEWHQDYGYWYHNGCLFPLLASCMIAVDTATSKNGCLQILKGSHVMGRLDHEGLGDQMGAAIERMKVIEQHFEWIDCHLNPGDALFFHCNVLHRSGVNQSNQPRWALICCYNAARNNPYKSSRHPQYSPLEPWPDERIKEMGHLQKNALRKQD